ncbi:MAG: hypothetical protein AAF533_20950 [Acidobacteriota bacterium]
MATTLTRVLPRLVERADEVVASFFDTLEREGLSTSQVSAHRQALDRFGRQLAPRHSVTAEREDVDLFLEQLMQLGVSERSRRIYVRVLDRWLDHLIDASIEGDEDENPLGAPEPEEVFGPVDLSAADIGESTLMLPGGLPGDLVSRERLDTLLPLGQSTPVAQDSPPVAAESSFVGFLPPASETELPKDPDDPTTDESPEAPFEDDCTELDLDSPWTLEGEPETPAPALPTASVSATPPEPPAPVAVPASTPATPEATLMYSDIGANPYQGELPEWARNDDASRADDSLSTGPIAMMTEPPPELAMKREPTPVSPSPQPVREPDSGAGLLLSGPPMTPESDFTSMGGGIPLASDGGDIELTSVGEDSLSLTQQQAVSVRSTAPPPRAPGEATCWQLRRSDDVLDVSLTSLQELARAGDLHGEQLVRRPDGRWVKAEDVRPLRRSLGLQVARQDPVVNAEQIAADAMRTVFSFGACVVGGAIAWWMGAKTLGFEPMAFVPLLAVAAGLLLRLTPIRGATAWVLGGCAAPLAWVGGRMLVHRTLVAGGEVGELSAAATLGGHLAAGMDVLETIALVVSALGGALLAGWRRG